MSIKFINQSAKKVSFGAYKPSDHSFIFTLLPWGKVESISGNGKYDWSNPAHYSKIQVILWADGKKIGPKTVFTKENVIFTADQKIQGDAAGVNVVNKYGQGVKIGIYNVHDYQYTFTLLPWGAKVSVGAGGSFDWSNELDLDRVQVIFFSEDLKYNLGRRTIYTNSTITLEKNGEIVCKEAGVLFNNKYGKNIQLGLYNKNDRALWFTLFPFGQRRWVLKDQIFDWQNPSKLAKLQVVIWDGAKRIAAKTIFSNEPVTFTEDGRIVSGKDSIEQKIEHIVVVMLENRSFDNLVGWLYAKQKNAPPRNIPHQDTPTYDGLEEDTYWNTKKRDSTKIFATKVANASVNVPNPNPKEVFPAMMAQMFGAETQTPDQQPDMSGFVQNYEKVDKAPPSK